MTIRIWLNGDSRELRADSTVAALLAELGRDPRTVAIEHNGSILSRDDFGGVSLHDGDKIELVQFVQGG